MNDEIQNRDGGAVQPREAIRSGAGLEELEAALQVLIRHAGRDGGYSPYYGQWQDILHGLGQLISAKRRDLSNTQSSPMPGQKTMNPPEKQTRHSLERCARGQCRGLTHRQRVFPLLCDWLDEEVPIEWLCRFLKLIHDTPNLDWLLLTKRPENWPRLMYKALLHSEGITDPDLVESDPETEVGQMLNDWLRMEPEHAPKNVWVGVSVEDQPRSNERIPALIKIPAKVRFLSVEPLLSPVDLHYVCFNGSDSFGTMPGIDWVIVGGESGHGARPCNVAWIRDIVRQCRSAGVPVFVKQLGAKAYEEDFAHTKECWNEDCQLSGGPEDCTGAVEREYFTLTHPKGGDPAEWPEDLRVRQMPEVKP